MGREKQNRRIKRSELDKIAAALSMIEAKKSNMIIQIKNNSSSIDSQLVRMNSKMSKWRNNFRNFTEH